GTAGGGHLDRRHDRQALGPGRRRADHRRRDLRLQRRRLRRLGDRLGRVFHPRHRGARHLPPHGRGRDRPGRRRRRDRRGRKHRRRRRRHRHGQGRRPRLLDEHLGHVSRRRLLDLARPRRHLRRRRGRALSARGDHAGVLAPPPLIYLAFLLAGFGIGQLIGEPSLGLAVEWRRGLAFVLVIGGLLLDGIAAGTFRRLGTPPEPWKPTTALATGGLYRFSR